MTLRVMATRHSAFYSPFICTVVGGFLEREGIEATYAVAGPGDTYRTATMQGRADVMQSAVSASWRDLDRGETALPVHFAQINRRDGFLLAAREPDPDFDWRRLQGKTILADHGAQPLAMLRYSLQRHDVDLSAVRLVDAGKPEQMERAFRSGEGDYIHLQSPAPHQLQHDRAGWVVAGVGAGLPSCAFSSICASRDFLARPELPGFLRAFARAKQWVQTTPPQQIAEIELPLFPGVPLVALLDAIAFYQQLGNWSGGIEISPEEYEQSLDVFASAGSLTTRHPYNEVCTRQNSLG